VHVISLAAPAATVSPLTVIGLLFATFCVALWAVQAFRR
jgi:hypothetical protein